MLRESLPMTRLTGSSRANMFLAIFLTVRDAQNLPNKCYFHCTQFVFMKLANMRSLQMWPELDAESLRRIFGKWLVLPWLIRLLFMQK